MDGLTRTDALVFVLCASNLPWDLDVALLRRLEKRILVDLPIEEARYAILFRTLQDRTGDDKENGEGMLRELSASTEGFSGADLVTLAKEAAMRPVSLVLLRCPLSKPAPLTLSSVPPRFDASWLAWTISWSSAPQRALHRRCRRTRGRTRRQRSTTLRRCLR